MTGDLDRLADLSKEVRRLEGVRTKRDVLLAKLSEETDDAGEPVYMQKDLVEHSGLSRERIRVIVDRMKQLKAKTDRAPDR